MILVQASDRSCHICRWTPQIGCLKAHTIPQAVVFSLKDEMMELSPLLADANRRGQVHRVDVDVLAPGAWSEVHARMAEKLGMSL